MTTFLPSGRRKSLLAIVTITAFGPLWAAFELGVVPRTVVGALILALVAPTCVALVALIDAAIRWSGRQNVLGSLEFSAVRLAIAMTAALGVVAGLLTIAIWFAGSGVTASELKRFFAEHFLRRGF